MAAPRRRKAGRKLRYGNMLRRPLLSEVLEDRRLLAGVESAPFMNALIATDVNASGTTTPLDALYVVNELNTGGARDLNGQTSGGVYYDANGDNYLSARDALTVINRLNGDGEDHAVAGFRLEATDLNGVPLAGGKVKAGEDFRFNVYVQDLRSSFAATGIFAAYLDVDLANSNLFDLIYGETQEIRFSNNANGSGTFTIQFNGQITGPISFGADVNEASDNIRLGLEALNGIEPGDVQVVNKTFTDPEDQSNNNPFIWEVRFVGGLRRVDQPLMDVEPNQLGPAGQVTVQVTELHPADINDAGTYRNTFITGATYPNGLTAFNELPNQFSDTGAFDGNGVPDKTAEYLVFYVDLEAVDRGTVTFQGSPADLQGSEILLFGSNDPLDTAMVDYGSQLVVMIEKPVNAVADTVNGIVEDSTDNTLDVLGNDFLETGSPGTLTIDPAGFGAPTQGGTVSATGDGLNVLYTPAPDFFGIETFTYTALDGLGNQDVATVTITVDNVNDDPDAIDDGFTVDEDSTDNILSPLANDDVGPANENETLTITGVGTPDNGGTVTFANTTVTYTPAADYFGPETFTYTIDDGNGGTDSATVTVTVTNINDDPTANDDTDSVNEDSSVLISVLTNDTISPDINETLTITAVGAPSNGGAAIISGTQIDYSPAPDYFGDETFTYTIGDGNGGSDTATVTVTVINVNDDPDAMDDDLFVDEFTTDNVLDLLANDVITPDANETLTIISVSTPTLGTVTNNGDHVLYSPPPAMVAPFSDTFNYTISDGNGGSDTATVNIDVEPVIRPRARDDAFTFFEDSVDNIMDVMANDLYNDGAVREITQITVDPDIGFADIDDNGTPNDSTDDVLIYTPEEDFFGTVTLEYETDDDFSNVDGDSVPDTATVTITIVNVNDDPLAFDDTFDVNEDSGDNPLDLLANDTFEPDPFENLTITDVGATSNGGTVTIAPGGDTVDYRPAPNFFGTDTFSYDISDGNGGTESATVTVNVANVNDDPTATADAFTVNEDTTNNNFDVLANDSFAPDVGETLSISAVGTPDSGGTLTFNGSITYSPAPDFFGTESFSYDISDGNGGSDTTTVTITVIDVNDDPVARPDQALALKNFTNQPIDVLANDDDGPDVGETLTLDSLGTPSQGGSATIVNNAISYTPVTDFEGFETIPYTITDGRGGSASSQVTIEVVDAVPNDVSGQFYFDVNNNGVRDASEIALGGVEITITGTNIREEVYTETVTTGADGSFTFSGVLPNSQNPSDPGYTLLASQAEMTLDGSDQIGGQGGTNPVNDVFANLELDLFGTVDASGNTFGELGVRPEFITIAEILASKTRNGLIAATSMSTGDQYWFSILEGWNGVQSASMTLASDLSSVEVSVVDRVGTTHTKTISTSNPHFRVMGHDKSDGYILRIDGTAQDLGFNLASNDVPEGESIDNVDVREVPVEEQQIEMLADRSFAEDADEIFSSWA